MTTKTTKTEAAALAYDNACAAYDTVEYNHNRILKAARIVETGGTLNTNQEDVLVDACRTKIGSLAYHMSHAELAEMGRQIAVDTLRAASNLCHKLAETADRLEQAAARREARKAAAFAAAVAA